MNLNFHLKGDRSMVVNDIIEDHVALDHIYNINLKGQNNNIDHREHEVIRRDELGVSLYLSKEKVILKK